MSEGIITAYRYSMHVLTESRPAQYEACPKGVPRYRAASGLALLRAFAWLCWRCFIRAIYIVFVMPLAMLLVLLVPGMRCVACNRHIWPWQKSTDARYTDNMDAMHEGCCPQLAHDIN